MTTAKRPLRLIVLFGLLALFPAAGWAADLSLPLNGNYRLGRYMPVRFGASSSEIQISADGAMTTAIANPIGGVAPFLIYASPVRNSPFSQPLHELTADERLIGFATDAPEIGKQLFPGSTVIAVQLDPAAPVPGNPSGWQSLDALVLDSSAKLSDAQITGLLAGGTIIAERAAAAPLSTAPSASPDASWPWALENGYWILRGAPALSAQLSDDAYQPVAGWNEGSPSVYRRHVVLLAIVFAALVIGATLFRSLLATLIAVALAAAAVIFLPMWDSMQSPITTQYGAVRVNSTPAVADTWVYQNATRPCDNRLRYSGLAFPILPSSGGVQNMTVVCDTVGNPLAFEFHLLANSPAAFVFRALLIAPEPLTPAMPVTTPMRLLLPHYYAGAPLGEIAPTGDPAARVTQWPMLVVGADTDRVNSPTVPKNDSGPSGPSSGPATLDSSNK
jgi:hypothetical protein